MSALFDAFDAGDGNQVTIGTRSATPVALAGVQISAGINGQLGPISDLDPAAETLAEGARLATKELWN